MKAHPVPSFESLTLDGHPVVVSASIRTQAPRLARVGEEDGLLVYGLRGEKGPTLVSHRIGGLFSPAPPRVGAATVHVAKDNMNAMGPLVAWPDGTFAASYGREWVLGAADEPGARATLAWSHAFDPASEAVYALEAEGDRSRVLRRSKRLEDGHVDDCGLLPRSGGLSLGVGAEGALFVAALEDGPKVRMFVASRAGLVSGATLAVPERARVSVLPRPGGAYVVVASFGVCVVHALDATAQPCGAPWSLPVVAPRDHLVACASWRDGVALASMRGGAGVGLVVTDGARATFSPEAIRGVMSTNLFIGLAASVDGKALALAYISADRSGKGGVFLARFRCDASEPSAAFVPTAAEPGRSIDSLPWTAAGAGAPAPAVAAPSPPPRAPSPPAHRPSPFGTRDALVRFFRRLGLTMAFHRVRGMEMLPEGDASGTPREGHLFGSDGQGNHFVAHWDATGVVLLGFDHDSPESEWQRPLDQREPGKHLPNVPDALAPLALRATDWGERLATEGLWIAAGDPGAHGESELDLIFRFFGRGEEEMAQRLPSGDPLGQLVARVADLESYTVTPADEEVILASGGRPRLPLAVPAVEAAVSALARLGVSWPDAVAHTARRRAQEEAAREEALAAQLPASDRALLVAAHSGDLEGARQAIANGASLDSRMPAELLPYTQEGSTPLLVAMHRGHAAIAELLIERGADVATRVPASHGGGTALRAAAAQGDLRLFRMLRERGASVEPDVASWGLLQAACYPRPHLPRGTPADCAEVIRLLLDAGAPLPNDAHCEMLVDLVAEGGAPELIPRLRRVYAEDVLPALPPPVDPSVAPRVAELLGQAADAFALDNARSLRLLSEAWQLDPLPALGDVTETLARRIRGPHPGYAVAARGGIDGEATLRALQQALLAPPDPRSAQAILGWLRKHDIYTNKAALARCIDAAAALLVHARDVRCVEALAQHCRQRPIGVGPTRESLRVALRALQETVPVPLDAEGAHSLARLEDALAGRRATSSGHSVRALFDAVYDAPDDDAPRQALAERLIEAGDPRGELIALQLARHAKGSKPTKREKELLADNGRSWLGELAPILGDDWVFERGFLWQATTAEPHNPGMARRHPVLPSGAGTQPEWATVRRLSLWRHAHRGTAGILRGPRLQRLQALCDVGPSDIRDLLEGPVRPLEQLELASARRGGMWKPLGGLLEERVPEKLPSLTSLRLPSQDGSVEWVARLATRLPALRELSVALSSPALAELGDLARARGLARVQLLGPADFAFEPGSGLLEITFPGRLLPSLGDLLSAVLGRARGLGVRRVIARTPVRAKLAADAAAPAFVRRSERLELRPVIEACEALGVPFAVEAHRDDTFAPNPTRAE